MQNSNQRTRETSSPKNPNNGCTNANQPRIQIMDNKMEDWLIRYLDNLCKCLVVEEWMLISIVKTMSIHAAESISTEVTCRRKPCRMPHRSNLNWTRWLNKTSFEPLDSTNFDWTRKHGWCHPTATPHGAKPNADVTYYATNQNTDK